MVMQLLARVQEIYVFVAFQLEGRARVMMKGSRSIIRIVRIRSKTTTLCALRTSAEIKVIVDLWVHSLNETEASPGINA